MFFSITHECSQYEAEIFIASTYYHVLKVHGLSFIHTEHPGTPEAIPFTSLKLFLP